MMTGNHTRATRRAIGAGIERSAWRRQQSDKSGQLESAAGYAGEDYSAATPQSPHRYLWEETHGYAD